MSDSDDDIETVVPTAQREDDVQSDNEQLQEVVCKKSEPFAAVFSSL